MDVKMIGRVLCAVVLLAGCAASAAIEIPKASGKALGVTRGKKFSKGIVFVDGKYLEPPYVVERWGVGIRINETPVVGQVIDWTEFLKTQDGVKVTKTETAPAPVAAPEPEPDEPEELEDSDSSLDDLFDDDPKPKKAAKKPAKKPARKPRPPKPTTNVTYSLEGEFVANEASTALLNKINKTRTDINAVLLAGGFICFGQRYSRVSGDIRTASQIIEKLPDIEKTSESEDELVAAVRSARLVYLTEPICQDLFRNRRDYLKLQARRDKEKSDRAFKKLMEGVEGDSRL